MAASNQWFSNYQSINYYPGNYWIKGIVTIIGESVKGIINLKTSIDTIIKLR